jgi:hypothetical protein
LGYGSKADSYPHEKPHSAGIDFLGPGGEVGYWQFNGTDWDVFVGGVQVGTIPGSGGGGSAGGIVVAQGSSDGAGPILATNSPAELILLRAVTLSSGWAILCKPSGSITVDLRYDASFPTTPDAGDSITGSSVPAISSGTSNTGALTGWTTTLAAGGILQVVVTANTGVRWFCLMAR